MLMCQCLRCKNITFGEFQDGIGVRCGVGIYDGEDGVPQYYSPTALVKYNTVAIVRATRKCGVNFFPMNSIGAVARFGS